MKWVEIGVVNSKDRFNLLSKYIKDLGAENSVEFIECTVEDLEGVLKEAQDKYDLIRIGAGLGEEVVRLFPFNSETIRSLRSADCLVPIADKWWSRSATFHGLQRVINRIGDRIDLKSEILVVGAGAISRAVIAAFVKMGFSDFNITNHIAEQATDLIVDLNSKYYGINFNFVPMDALVMLPGRNGIVVNTTPYFEGNQLLKELYFFNFLKPGGVVIDLVLTPRNTPLVQEAKVIGAATIEGYEIASCADVTWAQWCFGVEVDLNSYQDELKSILPAAPEVTHEKQTPDS